MMQMILYFGICFGASLVGALCGIGGGIIIKPLLDAVQTMDIVSINFLSSCTVFSMATYSVFNSRLKKEESTDSLKMTLLAIGSIVGGLIGKSLFSYLISQNWEANVVSRIQSLCLLCITIGILLISLYKTKIQTYEVNNSILCILIGVILGLVSAFFGIGGGPLNVVIMFVLFSMPTKVAAKNSLYIIFCSQLSSLVSSVIVEFAPSGSVLENIFGRISNGIPEISWNVLLLMIASGIIGGIVGRWLNKLLPEYVVTKLFNITMFGIVGINLYNVVKFCCG